MRGLALEGGGVRGAYQIGVVKALMDNGYVFDGFVGTSVGAVNAAILAQGDINKAIELWTNITVEKLFAKDEQAIIRFAGMTDLMAEFTLQASLERYAAIRKILRNGGMDTSIIEKFLEDYIDEEAVRNSGKDFGLVTISISDRMPLELTLEDIPQGQLFDYVMASASLPGFKPIVIKGKKFLDGAFYNNCPYNLLLEKNYDEVIVIRTNARGVFPKVKDSRVKLILPEQELGSIMLFTHENCIEKMEIGYNMGLNYVRA